MQFLKQSTAWTETVGPILDSAGAEYTGAVIGDLSISKNGTEAAMAAAATLTHVSNGHYSLVGTTGNSDTLGRITIRCNKSTYQMQVKEYLVLPAMVYDSLVLGTDRFDVNVTHVADTAQTAGDIIGDTNDIQARLPAALGANGNMKSDVRDWLANACSAVYTAGVPVVDPKGQTGWETYAALVGGEVTDHTRFTSALGNGQSGTTTTMVDSNLTQADTDYWKGSWILFTSGNIAGQHRLITGFTPATDTVTFAPALTQAYTTQSYRIIPAARVDLHSVAGTAQTAGDLAALVTTVDTVVDTILVDTNELQTDWVNGGRLDLILDIIAADTTTDIPATLTTIASYIDTEVASILAAVDTEVAAIKVVTDAITTTGAGLTAVPENAGPGKAWYVSTGGNDSNSGRNPSVPKLTIAATITAAASGDTIYLGPGTWVEGSLSTTKTLTIQGAGMWSTLIAPTSGTDYVLLCSEACITLRDLQIVTGTHAAAFQHTAATLQGHLIERCIITNTTAAGYGIYIPSLNDESIIRDSYITGSGNAAYFATDGGAVVWENSKFTGKDYGAALSPQFHFVARNCGFEAKTAASTVALSLSCGSGVRTGFVLDHCILTASAATAGMAVALSVSTLNALAQVSLSNGTVLKTTTPGGGGSDYHIQANSSAIGRVLCSADTDFDATKVDLTNGAGLTVALTTPNTDATIKTDATKLSGDATAADNAEAFFDGTGYAGTGNTIPTVTTLTQLTTAVTESYAADGAAPTPIQALLMILQSIMEISISGTTMTVKKLDGSTTAMTVTLNDATNPTSRTRSG